MIEQAGVEILWYAHFTQDGEGKTGLSPAITVYKDDSGTPEVNGANMTELADGFYYYKQTPSGEGFRVAVAKSTSADVDQKHVPAVMLIGKAGVEHLDAAVSSRSSHGEPDLSNLDTTVSSRATSAELDDIKGENWSAESDTLEDIRDAVANVPAQRRTQEL
ncbi:MAG: hypothetical protein R6V58_00545 [Planctomycetota bacterium]